MIMRTPFYVCIISIFFPLFSPIVEAHSAASDAFVLNENLIYGTLSYNNSQSTPLAGVPVHLKALPGYIVVSDTTDSSGNFRLSGFADGNYLLDASLNYEPGGVNTTDALAAAQVFSSLSWLPSLQTRAGDVNGNTALNTSDALLIARFSAQVSSSFPIGRFVQSHPFLNIQNDSINVHLWVLSAGDLNGSYQATSTDPLLLLDTVYINGPSVVAHAQFQTTGSGIYERGICWSTNSNPSTADQKAISGRGSFDFTLPINGMAAGSTYYFKAYATHAVGTTYSNEQSLSIVAIPSVETLRALQIGDSSVQCDGFVYTDGGSTVVERGFVYDTLANPPFFRWNSTAGWGIGSFTDTIRGLYPSTPYYFRAYAQNAVGTAYGSVQVFSLCWNPRITSGIDSLCLGTSGTFLAFPMGGIWRSSNPSIAQIDSITGLVTAVSVGTANILYTVAGSGGCANSTTSRSVTVCVALPSLTTTAATSISSIGAATGGVVTSGGGAQVSARGVVYGTSANPTLLNPFTVDGNGIGSFISVLTGLTPATAYRVRAYATNSAGTAYGNEILFSTSIGLPVLVTSNMSLITHNSAQSGGTISSDGGASIAQRGVCWSTTAQPTIANARTQNGTGTGTFTSNITGLTASTQYFLRAYATNSAGTAYGQQQSFTTTLLFVCGTSLATDLDGNNYATITLNLTINSQLRPLCWFKQNLRVSKYRNGDPIPTGLDTLAWRTTISGAVASPNDSAVYDSAYGKLYNWYAVADARGVCPTGWHVATDAEYLALTSFCQSSGYPNTSSNRNGTGRALKSCRQINTPYSTACNTTAHPRWLAHNNTNPHYGNDAFGFSALPAGARVGDDGTYQAFGGNMLLQTPNLSPTDLNYGYLLRLDAGNFSRATGLKTWGGSVRCVRDY
jgi:uncharacterized protein (TIGR02145 family)